jgi:hypothetical protein
MAVYRHHALVVTVTIAKSNNKRLLAEGWVEDPPSVKPAKKEAKS